MSPSDLALVRREIEDLIAGMQPGDEFIYHRGLLAAARHRMVKINGAWEMEPVEPLNTVATVFERAGLEGRLILTQRREGPGTMEYIARCPMPVTGPFYPAPRRGTSGAISGARP